MKKELALNFQGYQINHLRYDIADIPSKILNYSEKMSVGFSNVKTGVSANIQQAIFGCNVLVESKLTNGNEAEFPFRKITFDYTGIFTVINPDEKKTDKRRCLSII